MKKEMLINVLQPEESRIAILEDGVLEELYVERTGHESYVGNIYKGRIVNIEPSIQAAFVDFGVGRNGFLHVSDVEPAYYRHLEQRRGEHGNRRGGNFRDRDNGRGRDRGRGRDGDRRGPRHRDDENRHRDNDDRYRPRQPTEPAEEIDQPPPFPMPADDMFTIAAAEQTAEMSIVSPPPVEDDVLFVDPTVADSGTSEASPAESPAGERQDDKSGRRHRGRSRGRGRGRGRNDEARGQDAPPASKDAHPPGVEPPPSRPMESAEHRTREDVVSASLPSSKVDLSDDDLSFSSVRPPEPPQRTPYVDEPQPVAEERRSYAPERVVEPERATQPVRAAEPEPLDDFLDDFQESQPAPVGEDDFTHDERNEESTATAEEDLGEDFGEERMAEFEEEDEGPMPRRGRRDDRGGGRDRRPQDRRGGGRRPFGRPGAGRPKPLIQDIFKRGQEVLVQVIKEGIGTKGPTLSTYISIAGRYLVLMPGLARIGVSRKIADDDQRRRLRDILNELEPPKGLGFIIRTAGMDRTKKELQRDLAYLLRLWQVVVRHIKKVKGPAEIYQESDMIIRTIRDTFTSEIDTIWVDEPTAFGHAQEFLQFVMPRYANRIKCYSEPEPMFHKYGIEEEIARIQRRHVPLPMGGSIVIDQTEALVAIDVNSGNFRADNNAEETAYQMNLQAAKEIARQLRLRDLGGVIVNDFIDMREEKHRRGVEKAMRDAVKRDRARTKILKISQFGIIEMTRQRIRPSLKRSVYQDCGHCNGTGHVKTTESMSIDVMRMLQLAVHRPNIQRIEIKVHRDVANYLQNRKRKPINQLEEGGNTSVHILGDPLAPPELLEFVCYDNNNNEVKFLPVEEPSKPRRR